MNGVINAVNLRLRSVWLGLRTLPEPTKIWRSCAIALAFCGIATIIGLTSGILSWAPQWTPSFDSLVLLARLAVFPAFLEELFFRGFLIPQKSENPTRRHQTLAVVLSVLVFVLWHPANAALFAPGRLSLFCSVPFLSIVAFLGLANALMYILSRSLWPAVVLHWLCVSAWALFFGGKTFILNMN